MQKSASRWVGSTLLFTLFSLIGCTTPIQLLDPTATTTRLPPNTATKTPIPTWTLTSTPTTQEQTSTPTPSLPSITPTPDPIKTQTVKIPTDPISPETAFLVKPLAFWESDRHNSRVAYSPNGQLLALTSSKGVHLYDSSTLQAVNFIESDQLLQGIAFAPTDEYIAVGIAGGHIQLLSTKNGELLNTLGSTFGTVTSIAFSPDGAYIAGGTDRGDVRVWRLSDGALIHTHEWGEGDATTVVFSSDGELVISGTSKGYVRFWHLEEGTLVHSEVMAGSNGSPVAISPDGTLLAVGGGKGRVELWEMPSGIPLRSLIGHTNRIYSVEFSSDGGLLATSSADGSIRLWQVPDGTLLHTIPGTANILRFAPDDLVLITASWDHTVGFWGAGPSIKPEQPTPSPMSTPTSLPSEPFHRITLEDRQPLGVISDLWRAEDGRLWIAAESGIYIFDNGTWLKQFDGIANRILGNDRTGNIWALVSKGQRIGVYQNSKWVFYAADQGWQGRMSRHLVTGRSGQLWLVTDDARVQRFNPESDLWDTFTAADIGFEPVDETIEPGLFLTDIAVDTFGNIWVGSCLYHGIGIEGQGVRWFNGETWNGSTDTAGECVMDIEVDEVGRVFMSGFDAMIIYEPSKEQWQRVPLPVWERRQIITSVTLTSAGTPWIKFTRYGGAGPWHSNAVYHLQDGEWVADYDPFIDTMLLLRPASDGTFWLCADSEIIHLMGDRSEEIGRLPGTCRQMTVDGSDRLWIAGDTADGSGLWWYKP